MSLPLRSRKPTVSKPRPFASRAYDGGKPCPTCYAPMQPFGKTWACTKHGTPSKP